MLQIDIAPEFRGVSEMELWRCTECLLSFFAPQFLAGSPWMYTQLDNRGGYYIAQKWEYDTALVDLRGRQKILEIGCGSGRFMTLAKDAGLSVEGLEQNNEAISEAKRNGLRVREATVEDAAKQCPGIYDAVCGFQVLEHVANPKEFLDACCTLLKPGGLLLLAVPNQDSYVRHMVNPLDMPPHHMTRWTRETFRRMPVHFPLNLVRAAFEPLPDYQVGWYVDTYAKLLERQGFSVFMRPRIYSGAINLIRSSGLGRFLRGQNIYACYVRN